MHLCFDIFHVMYTSPIMLLYKGVEQPKNQNPEQKYNNNDLSISLVHKNSINRRTKRTFDQCKLVVQTKPKSPKEV